MTLASRVKENPKAFYRYIKNKRVTKEKVGPLKDKGGNLYLEAEDMGKILNENFASVFTQEKDMEYSEISVERANMLGHFVIKKQVVLDLLRSIKVDKAPGPNGIYSRLLREAGEEIAGALTKIFISSLDTGDVLDDCTLKVALQVNKVVKKAYYVLAFIGRVIEDKSLDVMLQLYKTL
eukprot:g31857.t1